MNIIILLKKTCVKGILELAKFTLYFQDRAPLKQNRFAGFSHLARLFE